MKIGDEVEYTETSKGVNACVLGVVAEIIEGCELLDIDTGERRPAVRFVIRDRWGALHTTQAMAAELTRTVNSDSPDVKEGEGGAK